jgi:hypothetical protein
VPVLVLVGDFMSLRDLGRLCSAAKWCIATGDLSLGQWLRYERDVQADFVRAFGEMPGPLLAVALMTDTDNTSSQLQAWYGRFRLEARQGQGEQGGTGR